MALHNRPIACELARRPSTSAVLTISKQYVKCVVIAWAAFCSLALPSTSVLAQSGSRSTDVKQEIFPWQSPQAQSAAMQDCQSSAANFATHGQCGQGDLACVVRLQN